MATYTIYATEDTGIQSSNTTYATARAGSNLGTSDTTCIVGQWLISATKVCEQVFYQFDVTSVTGAVTSAILNVNVQNEQSDTDFTLENRACSFVGPSAPTSAFVAGASLSAQTLYGSLSSVGLSAGAYGQFSDDALSAAVEAGDDAFQCFVSSDRQRIGNEPTGDEYEDLREVESVGTSIDPFLDVDDVAAGNPWPIYAQQ